MTDAPFTEKDNPQEAKAHTPGPWGYEETRPAGEFYFEIAPIVDGKLDWTREVAATAHGSEADARLIAAAPELLEALEAVSQAYHETTKATALERLMRFEDAIGRGDAAIKKAGGE